MPVTTLARSTVVCWREPVGAWASCDYLTILVHASLGTLRMLVGDSITTELWLLVQDLTVVTNAFVITHRVSLATAITLRCLFIHTRCSGMTERRCTLVLLVLRTAQISSGVLDGVAFTTELILCNFVAAVATHVNITKCRTIVAARTESIKSLCKINIQNYLINTGM